MKDRYLKYLAERETYFQGVRSLGRRDFIRVLLPAARMMADNDIRRASCHAAQKVGPQGFEPRLTGPKPAVLPLHHGPVAAKRGGRGTASREGV